MKRIFNVLMALMLLIAPCAFSEAQAAYPETECLPVGMALKTETQAMRVYEMESTGETWTVLQTGNVCCGVAVLSGDLPATMEEFIAGRWPDAWILRSDADDVLFMDMNAAGRCYRQEGAYVIEMRFGEFRSEERMSSSGAAAAMAFYRPQAMITEIELDEDDGRLIFEGDAILNGVEYEFGLDAHTGRLMEWDRD